VRVAGQTIKQFAGLTGCSLNQVKRIWAMHLAAASPRKDELPCRFFGLRQVKAKKQAAPEGGLRS
jgi:hypothetical protein